jgi:rhodanese-related sulfurtransferase
VLLCTRNREFVAALGEFLPLDSLSEPPRRTGGFSVKHTPGFLAIVNDAKSRVKELNFREVKRRLDAGEEFTLVDVREDNEWARGHLPGAVHLGRGIIERDIENTIPDKSATLVLYCGGGFRSALAADNLQKMGYSNCISMDGGWRAWTEAGFPTEKD